MGKGWRLTLLTAVACMCAAPAAQAAFPGANGKIGYTSVLTGASTINPDGTGAASIETGEEFSFQIESWSPDGTLLLGKRGYFSPAGDYTPHMLLTFAAEGGPGTPLGDYPPYPGEKNREDGAWSPDGRKVVYAGVNVINADGTNDTSLGVSGFGPAWSPDGGKIAFTRCCDYPYGGGISTVNPDGTGVTELTSGPREGFPDWSPDGERILFDSNGAVVVMNRDGSGRTTLVAAPEFNNGPTWPAFSPDGTKIAWMNWSEAPENDYFAPTVWVANSDGSNQTSLGVLGDELWNAGPSWQPLPSAQPGGYARPRGATPFHTPLVPAFDPCTSANRTHGPPLAFGSCNPPQPASPNLTVGGNGGGGPPAKSSGHFQLVAIVGAPGPPDTADAVLSVGLSNVMRASNLSDYTGELRATASLRVTGRDSAVPSTIQDFPLGVTVPCAATADPTLGATCAVDTTLDALVPGSVAEGARTIEALGQVRVFDGGPDENADTAADNALLAVQGVFVP